jgi:hypothetical protein
MTEIPLEYTAPGLHVGSVSHRGDSSALHHAIAGSYAAIHPIFTKRGVLGSRPHPQPRHAHCRASGKAHRLAAVLSEVFAALEALHAPGAPEEGLFPPAVVRGPMGGQLRLGQNGGWFMGQEAPFSEACLLPSAAATTCLLRVIIATVASSTGFVRESSP